MQDQPIWLASYPRSGNTLLRTILWHCFALPSASAYPNDLERSPAVEATVGHIERDAQGRAVFPEGSPPLFKTHEPPQDWQPAIYAVRDGRAACVSLWEFYRRDGTLEDCIAGKHRFGSWSGHLTAWQPWSRPRTLLLTYEAMTGDLPSALDALSRFLGRPPVATRVPARDEVARIDGSYVRKESDWRSVLTGDALAVFERVNGEMMARLGYRG